MKTHHELKMKAYSEAIPVRIYESFFDKDIHKIAVKLYDELETVLVDIGNRTDIRRKRLVVIYSVLMALKGTVMKRRAVYNNIDTAKLSNAKKKKNSIISRSFKGKSGIRYSKHIITEKGSGILWAMCEVGILVRSTTEELKQIKIGKIRWLSNRYLPTQEFLDKYKKQLMVSKKVLKKEPVTVKDSNGNVIKELTMEMTNKKASVEAFVKEYNEHLRKFDIKISGIPVVCADGILYLESEDPYSEMEYHSVINNADKGVELGYRLYNEFSQMCSENRLLTTVDGEDILGVDIKTSWPRIAYQLEGLEARKDIYPELYMQRSVGKVIWSFMANMEGMITNGKFISKAKLSSIVNYSIRERGGEYFVDYPEEINLHKLPVEIKQRIEDFNGTYGMHLMNHETRIVINTLKALIHKGVFCCSVHDCIYIKESDLDLAIELLNQEWDKHISTFRGLEPKGNLKPLFKIEYKELEECLNG